MDPALALAELLAFAERAGVQVRTERLAPRQAFGGGLCRLRGQLLIVVDEQASEVERATVMADALLDLGYHQFPVSEETARLLRTRQARRQNPDGVKRPGLVKQGSAGRRQFK